MVIGLDKFREAFLPFADNYVIIGGTACDIVLSGTDMRPRATNDIDMILVVENMTPEFGKAFWQFIKVGQYKPGIRHDKSQGERIYTLYRFQNPKAGYPVQIELLSRHPEILGEPSGFHIEPIPTGEDISSLSAIIMDDCYYNFTIQESEVENGLRIASPLALIALKVRAYLNLIAEREQGRQVNGKDIRKHRGDVMKLVSTLTVNEPKPVETQILESIGQFVREMRESMPNQSLEDALSRTSYEITLYLDALEEAFTLK